MIQSLLEKIDSLRKQFNSELHLSDDPQSLELVRVKYLGRKGELRHLYSDLGKLSQDEKAVGGKKINEIKTYFQEQLELKTDKGENLEPELFFDVTLPGRRPLIGKLHPLLSTLKEIKQIFQSMGFTVATGPEIDTEYYNFDALNTPADHPARDEHDTLYVTDNVLLRTHTSTVQIRTMEAQEPPVKIVVPGRCYRNDTPDATHSPFFHQIEGLYVDEGVTFGDLKGVLHSFARKMFGTDTKVRFRPSFFPFTEPSAEMDIWWEGKTGADGKKKGKWLEILGSGMVDPNVFDYVGYDKEKYTGFAFGMGIDRVAMLLYGIDDLRLFFENDLRFLQQF